MCISITFFPIFKFLFPVTVTVAFGFSGIAVTSKLSSVVSVTK